MAKHGTWTCQIRSQPILASKSLMQETIIEIENREIVCYNMVWEALSSKELKSKVKSSHIVLWRKICETKNCSKGPTSTIFQHEHI